MISLLVLLIIVIGLTAAVGFTILSLNQSAEIVAQSQRNATRMESIVGLLRGSARPIEPNGNVLAPVDVATLGGSDDASGRTYLPKDVVGDDRTPWGARYGYCPTALAAVAPGSGPAIRRSVLAGGQGGYGVRVLNSLGADYVAAVDDDVVLGAPADGEPDDRPRKVIGFVVSPSVNKTAIPSCRDIVYRDGAFVIAKGEDGAAGTVAAVTVGGNRLSYIGADKEATLHVAANAPDVATGGDTTSPLSLSAAIAYWTANKPANLVIALQPGTYNIGAGIALSSAAPGRTVRLVNAGGASGSVVLDTGGARAFVAWDVDGGMENVNLSPRVGMKVKSGARVRVVGGQIAQARLDGGDLLIDASAVVNHADNVALPGAAIEVTAGRLSLIGSGSLRIIDPGATAGGAAIRMIGGEMALDLPAVDAEVGAGGLPWLLTGSARLHVSPTSSGNAPQVLWDGNAAPAVSEVSVSSDLCENSFLCTASCPALTYPASGSCAALAPGGVELGEMGSASLLTQSRATSDRSWLCQWAEGAEDPRPLQRHNSLPGAAAAQTIYGRNPPASSRATAECSARSR